MFIDWAIPRLMGGLPVPPISESLPVTFMHTFLYESVMAEVLYWSLFYPFIPVRTIPCTKIFWAMKKIMAAGSIATIEAAIISGQLATMAAPPT